MKRTLSLPLLAALAIASLMSASPAHSGEARAKKKPASAVAALEPAQQRYQELMDHADGAARPCMFAYLPREKAHELIARFVKAARFVDISAHQPVKVELPEGFYHPLGRVVTFDKSMLTISREAPGAEYISMTKTAEGVMVEAKTALAMDKTKLVCVRLLLATIPYKPAAPAKIDEEAPLPSS